MIFFSIIKAVHKVTAAQQPLYVFFFPVQVFKQAAGKTVSTLGPGNHAVYFSTEGLPEVTHKQAGILVSCLFIQRRNG